MKRWRTGVAVLLTAMMPLAAAADDKGHSAIAPTPRPEGAREVMDDALMEFWSFFRTGDLDRSGYLERGEFFAHPAYEAAKWGEQQISFIYWMVDDDKDGKVSLQEWFNNELGQFQMGDRNHDGIIDQAEYDALVDMQKALFAALKFPE